MTPVPAHRLGEGPVECAVHPSDRPGREWLVTLPARAHQVGIEVIDVLGSDLVHRRTPEMRLQIALDDAARVSSSGSRPPGRGDLEPVFKQVRERAGTGAWLGRLGHELLQLAAGIACAAVDGLGEPPLAAGLGIGPRVHA
jgi:hypothetical protein